MKKQNTRKNVAPVSGTRWFPLIATLVVAAIMAVAVITVVSKQVVKGNGGHAGKGINNYDLRHTHATLLLSNGENPKVASERLGHSTNARHVFPRATGHARGSR